MSKIEQIISVKYGGERKYALVTVRLDDDKELHEVYVGGEVAPYLSTYNKLMAHVKWPKNVDKATKTEYTKE